MRILSFISLLLLAAVPQGTGASSYFPEPEGAGGWRKNSEPAFIRILGLDPEMVRDFGAYNLSVPSEEISSAIVIKDGWLVGEWYSSPEGESTRIYLASVGKTFAISCFGIAVQDSRNGKIVHRLDRNSPVYDPNWLAAGFPLSDPRKQRITFDQLFQHVAGFTPEISRDGTIVEQGRNQWSDYISWVVGHDDAWPRNSRLFFTPGSPEEYDGHETWGVHDGAYSSVGFAHVGLVLSELYSMPAHQFLWNRLLGPLGFSGIDFYNPPDPPLIQWFSAGGMEITPGDFARFSYFLLNDGRWQDRQILPMGWLDSFVSTPDYQNLRSNVDGYFGPQYPRDMFRVFGSGGNLAFIFPSQSLIVLRTGRVHNFFQDILERDFLRRAFAMIAPTGFDWSGEVLY